MKARRFAAATLLIASATALAVLCWRGIYVRYNADDYWTASVVSRRGFWESQRFWYERWSGRFSYTFLIGIVDSIGPAIVPLLVTIVIVSSVAATYALLKKLPRLERIAMSLALVYATAEGTIDVPQSILWQTGLLTYVVPIAGLIAWLATTVDRHTIRWYDVAVPFFIAGFSETNTIGQIVALLGLMIAIPQRRRIFGAALIASLCAFAVVALAPGNALRLTVTARPSAMWVAWASLRGTASFFAMSWMTSGIVLLLVFVAGVCLAPAVRPRHAVVAVAVAMAAAFCTVLATTASLGVMTPSRTLVVPHFFLVAAVAICGAAVGQRPPAAAPQLTALLLIVLSLAGPITSAVMRARNIPEAARFARAWDRLDGALRRNRGREVDVLDAPGNTGTLPFITHDPDAWSNRCISDYYSLAGIASAPRAERPHGEIERLPVYAVEGTRRHEQQPIRLAFQ